MPANVAERTNVLLDTLTIELLDLIEQQVRCQLDIEDAVVSGQLLVAKTRFTLGKNAVTNAQLPTEHSPEFEALSSVTRNAADGDGTADTTFALQRQKADREAGRPEPLNWFGILLPQSMHAAQRMFVRAVEGTVQLANVQASLRSVMQSILNVRHHVASTTTTAAE